MSDPVPDGELEQGASPRKGGRPQYKPTEDQRLRVRELRGTGAAIDQIAAAIGVSRNTLRKHFVDELQAVPAVPTAATEQQLDLAGTHKPAVLPIEPPEAFSHEHEPNLDSRLNVKLMKANGWSDDRIARQVGISRNTLLKHYAEELDAGADAVQLRVLRNYWFASGKGSVPASDRLLGLAGHSEADSPMLPEPAAAAVRERVGKKVQAHRDAQTAHKGTKWERHLN